MEKILTIAIPSFNGATKLKCNLENITSIIQKNSLQCDVNILVSLNASTDISESICIEYIKYDYFKYYIQKENIGYDRNVDSVVNNSATQYVWLLSDDDTMTEKGLVNTLKILKEYFPSSVFINHKQSSNQKIFGIRAYTDKEKFINESRFFMGLISSNIISRELWLEWDVKKYIGSQWIHMGYVVELLNNHHSSCIICVYDTEYLIPEIVQVTERLVDRVNPVEIGMLLVNLIVTNLTNSEAGIYWGKKVIAGAYPKTIIIARYRGWTLTRDIKKKIKIASSYNMFRYYFCIVPFILMPAPMITFCCNCVRLFNRTTKKINSYIRLVTVCAMKR